MTEKVIMEGWMTKLGGVFHTWRRRWFVLTKQELAYFTQPGIQQKGSIPLDSTTIVDFAPETKKKNAIKVVTPGSRTYMLITDTYEDATHWISAIKNVITDYGIVPDHVSRADIVVTRIVGQSTFGSTFLVKISGTNGTFVMKGTPISEIYDFKSVMQSLQILISIEWKPISCPIRYLFDNGTTAFTLTDWIEGGEFFSVNSGILSEPKAKLYIADLIAGLTDAHSKGVIYGDLHPSNLLIDGNGRLRLAASGFGYDLSKKLYFPAYSAPEVIEGNSAKVESDFWSVGVLFFKMLCGECPFNGADNKEIAKNVLIRKTVFPKSISAEAKGFIEFLLRIGGRGAVSDDTVKNHKFFEGFDWRTAENVEKPEEIVINNEQKKPKGINDSPCVAFLESNSFLSKVAFDTPFTPGSVKAD